MSKYEKPLPPPPTESVTVTIPRFEIVRRNRITRFYLGTDRETGDARLVVWKVRKNKPQDNKTKEFLGEEALDRFNELRSDERCEPSPVSYTGYSKPLVKSTE